jgi:hypothetical protein
MAPVACSAWSRDSSRDADLSGLIQPIVRIADDLLGAVLEAYAMCSAHGFGAGSNLKRKSYSE